MIGGFLETGKKGNFARDKSFGGFMNNYMTELADTASWYDLM
jgi:hypothetical protein